MTKPRESSISSSTGDGVVAGGDHRSRRPRIDRRPRVLVFGLVLATAFVLLTAAPVHAQVTPDSVETTSTTVDEDSEPIDGEQDELGELLDMSLEDLMNIEVISVSKKTQKLRETAAAVYVITQDEIQQAGARSLPEALRLAPGVEVAQITRNRWAVTVRGFNGVFANKLLVLVDGRQLYTPLFGGVFWNQHPVLVENIDRIEVIRGPGATLWGANAVNGIINVITKKADALSGGAIKTVVGTDEIETSIRYGMALGEDAFVRAYLQYFNRDGFVDAGGGAEHDDYDSVLGGFRVDWDLTSRDELMIQGNAFTGNAEQALMLGSRLDSVIQRIENRIDLAGASLLGRWTRELAEDSSLSLQFYWDHTERKSDELEDLRDTFDLDFQHRFRVGDVHDLVWGVGYRFSTDETVGSFTVSIDPDQRDYQVFSAFAQDDITIVENELHLILGAKFEHNDFSGFEFQPSIRFLWTPDELNTVWGAVSRAVRTPSRGDHDVRLLIGPTPLPNGTPAFVALNGNRSFNSERLVAYELGYRIRPLDNLSFDLAIFYNDYDHLASFDPRAPFLDPQGLFTLPALLTNESEAVSYGLEITADWRITPELRLSANYSFIDFDTETHGTASPSVGTLSRSPRHRFNLRAHWNLTDTLQLNGYLQFVDDLSHTEIPSYLKIDCQIAWRPTESLTLAVGVKNLLDDRHPEFVGDLGQVASEIERTAYLWLEWSF